MSPKQMFAREIQAAANAQPFMVSVCAKLTRNRCPMLLIRGTGVHVTAVPAKGYRKSGLLYVYYSERDEGSNHMIGEFAHEHLVELIVKFGSMRPRSMACALSATGMVA